MQRIVFGSKSCVSPRICYSGNSAIPRLPLFQNISVVDLVEGEEVPHILGTKKISALFFDSNNRWVKEIDFDPIEINKIKVYLPFTDSPTEDKFTGDIFLTKRA